MTLFHSKVECCIVPYCWLRKLRHCHQCEEELCEICLQKLGCMTNLHAQLECCTVPDCFLRKLRHFHHYEEGLCDHRLQTFGCMTLLYPEVECCIVPHRSFRKLKRCHHCKEVLCGQHVLRKPLLGALCLEEKVDLPKILWLGGLPSTLIHRYLLGVPSIPHFWSSLSYIYIYVYICMWLAIYIYICHDIIIQW